MLSKIQSFQEKRNSDIPAFYAGRVPPAEYIPSLVEFWWSISLHKILSAHCYPLLHSEWSAMDRRSMYII